MHVCSPKSRFSSSVITALLAFCISSTALGNVIRKLIWFGIPGMALLRPTSENHGNIVRTDKSILGVGQWNWSVYSTGRWNQVPLIVTSLPRGSKGPSTPESFQWHDDFVDPEMALRVAIFYLRDEDALSAGTGVNLMRAIRVVDNSGLSAFTRD